MNSDPELTSRSKSNLLSESQFEFALQGTGVAVWLMDAQTQSITVSPGWQQTLGYSDAEIRDSLSSWLEHLPADEVDRCLRQLQDCLEGNRQELQLVHRMRDASGNYRWMLTRARPRHGGDGKTVVQMVGSTVDITEQRRFSELFSESINLFQDMSDAAPVLIWMSGPDKKRTWFNQRWLDFTGRTMEQEMGDRWTEGVDPADVGRCLEMYTAAFQRQTDFETEYRLRNHSGAYRWVLDRGVPRTTKSGEFLGYVGVCTDIHDQKMAADAVRVEREVLRELLNISDRERQLIAHEIHDGFIQDVVGADMMLQSLMGNEGLQAPELNTRLQAAVDALNNAINEGRRLISELRPLILDEQGILSAIDYLTAVINEGRGPHVELTYDGDFSYLPALLEGTVFRMIQEALNNVLRHSQSERATVSLSCNSQQLFVRVQDWGVGFDPSQSFPDRYGLRGIYERARLFAGTAKIESRPGQGTTVSIELPIKEHRSFSS